RHLLQRRMRLFDAAKHLVEHAFLHGGVAAPGHELVLVAVELLEQVALEVGAGGHVHHFKDGDQREMVVDRAVAPHQVMQAREQVFQPQHGADAFVEGIFVKNQRTTWEMLGTAQARLFHMRQSFSTQSRNSCREMPSLTMTWSATARRCSRLACCASTFSTAARGQPGRAMTRWTWVCGLVSITSTSSTRPFQRVPDSASSGTSYTPTCPGRAWAACCAPCWPIRGCRMASRACRCSGWPKARARIASRSMAPPWVMRSGPKCW